MLDWWIRGHEDMEVNMRRPRMVDSRITTNGVTIDSCDDEDRANEILNEQIKFETIDQRKKSYGQKKKRKRERG